MSTAPTPVRTLGYEEAPPAVVSAAAAIAKTDLALGNAETLAAVSDPAPRSAAVTLARTFTPPSASAPITVLPRVDGGVEGEALALVLEPTTRYEPLKLLGAGGMGEVVLVRDHDIARPVALKRMLPEMQDPVILARFVDEIRTVGRLEHPNIVPIHDVGVDELGRYFFVMKYVEGETLESIIDKLRAGNAEYLAKYTFEQRIELFMGVLHALEYAHTHGVIHRDVKPANVMVGRYGEVVLMDWGIAKPIGATRDAAALANGPIEQKDGERGRMYATRVGSVIGTPAYMSPEQARGECDKLDPRSDLYSAVVMFSELLSLKHYLAHAVTLDALLTAIKDEEITFMKILSARSEGQPAELMHFVHKGLHKDPAKRFQSAREMIESLQGMLEGKVKVQCHITMTKRMSRELSRFVDRNPNVSFAMLVSSALGVIAAFVVLIRMALHA